MAGSCKSNSINKHQVNQPTTLVPSKFYLVNTKALYISEKCSVHSNTANYGLALQSKPCNISSFAHMKPSSRGPIFCEYTSWRKMYSVILLLQFLLLLFALIPCRDRRVQKFPAIAISVFDFFFMATQMQNHEMKHSTRVMATITTGM